MSVARHALVIGAGPAGSAVAAGLSRAGWRVTLAEARAFPRVKVCGEYVSPSATALLESLVPPTTLRAAGARKLDKLVIEAGDQRASWRMPAAAWSLSRAILDTLLLDAARATGAQILQPARVQHVRYAESWTEADLADHGAVRADIVIHADGSGRHDPAGPTPTRPGVVAFKCHFDPGRPTTALSMRSTRGGYIGAAPVEVGLGTCALVAPRDAVTAHRGDTDTMVRSLWPQFDPRWRRTEWLACGVPDSGYIPPGHPRSFRIGNAAAAVEPIGGEGIGLAFWSGLTLAGLLARHDALESVQREFATLYRARLRFRRPACRLAAEVFARPPLLRTLWPTLAAPGLVLRPWYALTGKPLHAAPAP